MNLHFPLMISLLSVLLASCSGTIARDHHEDDEVRLSGDSRVPENRPNIIFVVADDMGWQDTGYSGNPIVKTPNLDAMAAVGLDFRNFYSAHATCSPGRMAILTGRTPLRARMVTTVGAMQAGEVTVAKALKGANYETAHYGKWGLGRKETHPLNVGFDKAIWSKGHYNNGVSFYDGFSNQSDFYPDLEDEKPIRTVGESSVATMELALDFVREKAKRAQPFFLQVSFGSPHGPHIAHEDFKKLYRELPQKDMNYYGEISGLDSAVGKLRQELRRLKIEENTIVWFVSDNGGIREGSGGRLKGKIGVRTLGLLEWPAKIPKPMISDIPVSHVDMYPTVLDIAGVTLEHQPVIDGVSLMSLFEGRMKERPKPLGFTKGGTDKASSDFIHGNGVWIDGPYKMRQTRSNKNKAEQVTLHDIFSDPKELNDLSATDPSRVEKMLNDLNTWRKSVKNSYFGKDYE